MYKGYDEVRSGGFWWVAVYKLLLTFVTNWNALLAKVDADTADTAWATAYGITTPSIGATYGKDISPLALPQGKVVQLLDAIRTNYNATLTAFAIDDGIDGTTIFTNLKFSATEHLIDEAGARIKQLGEFQDEIALFLDNLLDRYNSVLKALDADATLTDTDYYTTYVITDVVETFSSSSSSSSRSSSSSSSSCSSSSCSSSSSSCRSSSSSSSCSSSSCSSSSSLSSSSSCRSSSSSSSSSSCRSSSSSSSSSCSSSSSSRSSSSSKSSSSSSSQSIG